MSYYYCYQLIRLSACYFLSLLLSVSHLKLFGFSYCGAQIFEIYGLGKEVVDISFCGSKSSIGGLTLDEVLKQIYSYLNLVG